MTEVVSDTEPLVAYLYDEPGADAVTDRLQAVDRGDTTAAVSHATVTELVVRVADASDRSWSVSVDPPGARG